MLIIANEHLFVNLQLLVYNAFMIVTAIKTHKITQEDKDINLILDKYISQLKENSVVAIASKIVAICEGRMVKPEPGIDKDSLAKQEAELYLPREFNQYGFMITINQNILVASAGVDESNSNGFYTLWPKDPQASVNKIREYLCQKFKLRYVGVVMTDSRTSPLRWGVTGVALAYSGFAAINSYIGKPDIFGKLMHAEKVNVADTLATTAVGVMGEGDEQQPLAIIEDANYVSFQDRNPNQEELDSTKISIGDDVYSSLLNNVRWEKGGNKKN